MLPNAAALLASFDHAAAVLAAGALTLAGAVLLVGLGMLLYGALARR
jgi:hypothetical protein